ncbi:hypothetical protein JW998_07615 [candidate division KSB1 bacterium]|nr:hypothetical protein [candidate division KSB1 bacterium]
MSLISDVRIGLARLDQSPRNMKKFGITMAVIFGLLATLIFILGSRPQRAWWLWSIGALFLVLVFFLPFLLKPIHRLWMGLSLVLGYFMSRLLLTLLFFLVITPIGLAMRLFGKDILNEKIEPGKDSYWIKRPVKKILPDRYEKLF